ncbi:hypothetical protein BSKO_00934 [Bryopsis sp. KO-2023]|nr:hypothetical protein BSKO_00934 [Bryopsis sp. KO-2023]
MSRSVVLSAVGIGAAVLIISKVKTSAFVKEKRRANSGQVPASPDAAGAVPIILRNNKGIELYVRRWDAPAQTEERKELKGLIVMVHGDLLTSEFFRGSAATLASKGFAIYSYDQRGYGLSGCMRGVERHIDSFSEYNADLGKVVDFARSDNPGLPCFLYGEDMGATVALAYAESEDSREKIAGLVLASPLLECPALEGTLGGLSNSLFPLAKAPKWKSTCGFEELFPDAAAANAAKATFDERNPTTVRKVSEMRKMCGHVKKNVSKISLPVLLMHGNEDKRNDGALSDQFQESLREAGCSVFYRPYPDGKHGLLQDPDKRAFPLGDMQAWLVRHASETKGSGSAEQTQG